MKKLSKILSFFMISILIFNVIFSNTLTIKAEGFIENESEKNDTNINEQVDIIEDQSITVNDNITSSKNSDIKVYSDIKNRDWYYFYEDGIKKTVYCY